MFERNKADDFAKKSLAVEIILEDGRKLDGNLFIRLSGSIYEELNSEKPFILFKSTCGTEYFVAKSKISLMSPRETWDQLRRVYE